MKRSQLENDLNKVGSTNKSQFPSLLEKIKKEFISMVSILKTKETTKSTLNIQEINKSSNKSRMNKEVFMKYAFIINLLVTLFIMGYIVYLKVVVGKDLATKEVISLSLLKESIDKKFSSQEDYKNLNNKYLISENLIPVGWKISKKNELINSLQDVVIVEPSENNKQYKITYTNINLGCTTLVNESSLLFKSILINTVVVKASNHSLNEDNVRNKCSTRNESRDITFVSESK